MRLPTRFVLAAVTAMSMAASAAAADLKIGPPGTAGRYRTDHPRGPDLAPPNMRPRRVAAASATAALMLAAPNDPPVTNSTCASAGHPRAALASRALASR